MSTSFCFASLPFLSYSGPSKLILSSILGSSTGLILGCSLCLKEFSSAFFPSLGTAVALSLLYASLKPYAVALLSKALKFVLF